MRTLRAAAESGKDTLAAFQPDWTDIMTPQEAEDQLEGFKFFGPGWYTLAGDTMLVIAFFFLSFRNVAVTF